MRGGKPAARASYFPPTPEPPMFTAKAYGATSPTSPMTPMKINRRDPHAHDVQIEILFCGICHSDLHYARNEWSAVMPAIYPAVPGHEIIGRVTRVGSSVTRHKVGDTVAVGCLVESDMTCPNCKRGYENLCPQGQFTYGTPDKYGTAPRTLGGYSDTIVVHEHFVLRVPKNLDLAGAAPLLCAGITTYSPLRRFGVGPGRKVGVVGLGGLGHMAVKLARAMGAHVTVFTTSPSKVEDAQRLGAHEAVIHKDAAAMARHAGTFDYILNTVSADHDIHPFLNLLAPFATMTLVGAPEKPLSLMSFALLFGNRNLSGSIIGGIPETQEMLDFCGEHNITADVEVIPIQKLNEAYTRLLKSDVKYRFCIDMASLRGE
jgi:uncharacterized zinc-type alcohol dehydrogenase-like protein